MSDFLFYWHSDLKIGRVVGEALSCSQPDHIRFSHVSVFHVLWIILFLTTLLNYRSVDLNTKNQKPKWRHKTCISNTNMLPQVTHHTNPLGQKFGLSVSLMYIMCYHDCVAVMGQWRWALSDSLWTSGWTASRQTHSLRCHPAQKKILVERK